MKKQIAIVGSLLDQTQMIENKENVELAKKVGEVIAETKNTLLFGFEGDFTSYSEIAAKASLEKQGNVIAFAWSDCNLKSPQDFFFVNTGLQRAGGREFILISSADLVVSIGGGSGTLGEIVIAYQKRIPIYSFTKTGGISNEYSNRFIDSRKHDIIHPLKDINEFRIMLENAINK